MEEFRRFWTVRKCRKSLTIRYWWNSNPLRDAWRWLIGSAPWWKNCEWASWHLKTSPGCNDTCWCPCGSTTNIRITFFGVGVFAWLSRDTTTRPCWCDKAVWLLFPDSYADEIEEYGREKLQAEFPDVKPLDEQVPA